MQRAESDSALQLLQLLLSLEAGFRFISKVGRVATLI
jgi:hypothetical protein